MKSGKYLKYAIGEIFLVVVGILIALSINNLNETSKSKKFEHRMLNELKKALDEDVEYFTLWESLLTQWEHSTLYLIDQLGEVRSPTFNRDSVVHHLTIVEGYGILIVYNDGPYEALKSSGMDKISNDSLRNEIAKLYSRDLRGLDTWVNEVLRVDIDKKFRLVDEIFDYKFSQKDGEVETELIIENMDFLSESKFVDLLISSRRIVRGAQNDLSINKRKMEKLRDHIEEIIN